MIEKKILVVDDEESQRDVMQRVLNKLGYAAKIADGPENALKILENEVFPLIITDLSMPGMDGTILCRRIKEIHSKSIIYALSGYIASYETDRLDAVGFDGYLSKPSSVKVLKQAIEGAFDKFERVCQQQ